MSKAKPICPHIVRTQAEVAVHFGLAAQSIRDWMRNGMPGRPGHWDLLDIEVWRRKRRAGGEEVKPGEVPTGAKQRREHFQAERERLKYETETTKLIPIDDYERALTERSGWITTVLETLPGIFAPLVAGKTVAEAQRVMRRACRKLQEQAYGKSDK